MWRKDNREGTPLTRRPERMAAATVFSGAFLLFLIQPMLGRTLLPVFGGSASVWGVCLAAYQVLLVVGYAYAHGLAKRPVRFQRRAHRVLLSVATAWAFAVAAWRLSLNGVLDVPAAPSLAVLFSVLVFVGLPYVLLAAGGTLVQVWLAGSGVSRNVYQLYAVSNLGSLSGLMIYPFVLEPFVPLTVQWWAVAAGFAGYSALIARMAGQTPAPDSIGVPDRPAPSDAAGSRGWLWFLLPGVTTFLLNAVIAHLFTDVTPLPLVWVVMLAVFLLSYVAGFSRFGTARRGVWCGLAALSLAGLAVANGRWGTGSFYPNAAAAVATVFCVGVVLHGWLYAERPQKSSLTRYYLAIAAGGAAGGVLSSLVAPVVFDRVVEYPLILCVCAALLAWRAPRPRFAARSRARAMSFSACCGAAWLVLSVATARHTTSRTVFRARNFYGCLRVTQTVESFGSQGAAPVFYLWCGQTTHGIQVRAPFYQGRGTAYYGRTGGGIALLSHPKYQAGKGMKVGVVGLGAGTLACYGRPSDLYRFYEINPQIVKVATDRSFFSYLPDAKTPIDLVPGDARQMLEKEQAAGDPLYDALVIDAYSGDAVPYHLATREAFRLYFDRLAPDGVLAVHVSNWHIDLLPLCKAVAKELGVHPYGVVSVAEDSVTSGAIWVFMTRQANAYRYPGKASVREVVWENIRDMTAPTDEKGSLVSLLRF
ncbi:MAG TPA: fused MFS/spermidine synthase [Kiritimatiellia bacterium]|nr:fused MFS/spermidine synthase [Kiritimatiellia bacterium]HPS08010.1 fused MFS/spermidine synthase [Kiritimatiellia bacterium]